MSTTSDLMKMDATEVVLLLRRRKISPLEIVRAALERIEALEGMTNAIPTLCADSALTKARELTDNPPPPDDPFWLLAGLPLVVKDLTDVKGVRTTYGSTLFAEHVPDRSDLLVQTLESRGAIVVGKSNTPEFGAGGNTFNEVFGATKNPWNLQKTAGGSSGGSAAALAAREIHLATGSDHGGSLRIPASFCSVVGLRPSPGRVAHGPELLPFSGLVLDGPMARNVSDVALMLDAMKGMHPADPLSLPATEDYLQALQTHGLPKKVAFSPDLGITPVDPEVAEICEKAALRFEQIGANVETAGPDLSDAAKTFHILRAFAFSARFGELARTRPEELKPEVLWNIEQGFKLNATELAWALQKRGEIYARLVRFFDEYDLLLCPSTVVPPFDVTQRYLSELGDHRFETYVDWFAITYVLTLTALPVLSLPCGFTTEGLPVGLQIAGKPRGESSLLGAAFELEQILGLKDRSPDIA